MKSYTKGILVGISIVLGSLLLMGYTSSEKEVGRYQIELSNVAEIIPLRGYKLDTVTGKVWYLERNHEVEIVAGEMK